MKTKIGQQVRDKFAAFVPDGYSADDLRIASARAQVQVIDELDASAKLALTKVQKEAGPPMVNAQGKPTILRIVSWIGHADVPNKNRDSFVKEELEAIASTLFRAPNFGVMDFNHSAVRVFSGEPKVIGVWHKAEWAFDATANGGKGAWGILATGIMYAWLFPDIADKLLADQARSGSIKVSWTWIPGSVEFAKDANGSFMINHNPVFFTVAVLDVPPADADATGKGTEDPAVAEDDLKTQVLVAESLSNFAVASTGSSVPTELGIHGWWMPHRTAAGTGGAMNEDTVRLAADLAAANQKVTEFIATLAKNDTDLAARDKTILELTAARDAAVAALAKAKTDAKAEFDARVAELTTARDSAVEELAKSQVRISEIETSRDAIVVELDAAIARIPELEAANKALTEQLATIEAAKAEVTRKATESAKVTRLKERIAALPETFRNIHITKPEETRTRVEAKWAEMSDEAWGVYVQEELLGYQATRVGFVLRTAREGVLPTAKDEQDDGIKSRVQRLLKH